jgi:hypothetical protein
MYVFNNGAALSPLSKFFNKKESFTVQMIILPALKTAYRKSIVD